MFELPSKIAQATEALVVIALEPSVRPVSGKQLSEVLGVPPRFLEQTMQQLVHAGLLRSVRGPRGGYTLARERRRIALRDISEALCESKFPTQAEIGTQLGREVVLPAYRRVEHRLMEFLDGVTLAELCEAARAKQLNRAPAPAKVNELDTFVI